jgi:ribonuclease G
MDERKNRQKVMAALEEALKADRAPSKSLAFNEFGLVAITRKRVRQSLERTLCQACAYCNGSGLVKSPASVCLEILAEARKIAPDIARRQVTLRVNPEVGKALKAKENTVLQALEELTGKGVIIRSDPSVHVENFYFD